MSRRLLGVGLTGTGLTDLERSMLRDETPYAVVLFGRNVDSEQQLKELIEEIRSLSSEPPLLMIDEEGGRVDRLRHILPGLPSAEAFLEGDRPEELIDWFGSIIGKLLRYFQIEVNLAPVVDIATDPTAPGLERRCFGPTGASVTHLVDHFMGAHHAAGAAVCLKHFPGMGSGNGDPHYGASVIDVPLSQLLENDLTPYRELGNEARAVMIGHATYPQVDGSVPATLSRRIGIDLLRNELGFRGVAISDDMEMHAVSDLAPYEEIGTKAILAGSDIVLFCSHIERMPALVRHLEKQCAENEEFSARCEEAIRRGAEYREHCLELVRRSAPQPSLSAIADEADRFYEALRLARFKDKPPLVPAVDRRKLERDPAKGRTGREEWT